NAGDSEDQAILRQAIGAMSNKPFKQKWILTSDGQPANPTHLDRVNAVIAHMAANHPDTNSLIYAGDIAHRGSAAGNWGVYDPILYPELLDDMRAFPVPRSRVYYLNGNHDRDYG